MAMTKEELLEMIDSTIYENENKAITGGALNAALTAIVEAMGTGSGSGGGEIYILPAGLMWATSSDLYTFTSDEVAAFKAAIEKLTETTFLVMDTSTEGESTKLNIISAASMSMEDGSTTWLLGAAMVTYGNNVTFALIVDATGTSIMGYTFTES